MNKRLKQILLTGQFPRLGNDMTEEGYHEMNAMKDRHRTTWRLLDAIVPMVLALILFGLLTGPENLQWVLDFTPIGNTR